MPRSISSGTWLTTTAKAVNAPSATAAISSRNGSAARDRIRRVLDGTDGLGGDPVSGQRPRSPAQVRRES